MPPPPCSSPLTLAGGEGRSLLPASVKACSALQLTAAVIGMVLGFATIAVWLGPARGVALWPGAVVMRMNTAVAVSAAALSLALWFRAAPGSRRGLLAKALGLFVALVGGFTALQDVFGLNLFIDEFFVPGSFPGDLADRLVHHSGRMSLNASLSFLCLGCALTGLDAHIRGPRGGRLHTAPIFALLGALPTALALVGYLVGAQGFTGLLKSTSVLPHTAASLLLLCLGTLAARPDRAPVSGILSTGTDGLLLRWLMPGSVTLLIFQGWMIMVGRRSGWVEPGEGTALMLYGSLVLLSCLIVLASRAVAGQEAKAHRAERAYRADLVRAKEEAEQANRAKDHFLAALSHELRTPLTPVLLSAISLRQDERLPEDVRSDLAMIERNVGLEARLIDDLLDLTRIAQGKLQLHKELCDAHSLLGHAVEIIRDEAERKRIEIELDLQATLSGLVGDPARLQQVFWNLLKNAVKFTPPGGRIQLGTEDGRTGQLQVQVSDTGIGFPPETAETLFLAFEQGDLHTAQRFGGLGLGLSIARAIVDLHGGVISARSAGLGQGAVFRVELPGTTEPPSGLSLRCDGPARAPSPHPIRILLVDDHEATLTVLAKLLRRLGHQVVIASSVAEGVAAGSQSGPFDLLISDLGLPDGSGHELMQKLRAQDPELAGIALSGFGLEKDLQHSHEAGFLTHLVKPIDFGQLQAVLDQLPGPRNLPLAPPPQPVAT